MRTAGCFRTKFKSSFKSMFHSQSINQAPMPCWSLCVMLATFYFSIFYYFDTKLMNYFCIFIKKYFEIQN